MIRNSKRSRAAAESDSSMASVDQRPDEKEKRARLEQFNRYFEGVLDEKEELERTVTTLGAQLKDTKEELERMRATVTQLESDVETRTGVVMFLKRDLIEQVKEVTEQHQIRIRELEAEITALKAQAAEFDTIRTGLEQAKQKQIEVLQLRVGSLTDTLRTAQAAFVDCITLETDATCVPLTSGQFTNLEGLVKIWTHESNFNGDVWFPFQCPLTKTTTTPVKDLAIVDLMSRMAAGLGLEATPPFFFRHRASEQDHWLPYSLSEQVLLFSKLVLAYHRRHSQARMAQPRVIFIQAPINPAAHTHPQDASFTVAIKTPSSSLHIISCERHVQYDDNNAPVFYFLLSLNVVAPDGSTRQHRVELEGVERLPFPPDIEVSSRPMPTADDAAADPQ